jgi:CRP/FNR family transcriptional regulator, dissimilatory nitrate respiration regulator
LSNCTSYDRKPLYLEIEAYPKGKTVNLNQSLKDIAEEIGLSQESLSRVLSQLQKDGVISRKKRQSVLLQASAQP